MTRIRAIGAGLVSAGVAVLGSTAVAVALPAGAAAAGVRRITPGRPDGRADVLRRTQLPEGESRSRARTPTSEIQASPVL